MPQHDYDNVRALLLDDKPRRSQHPSFPKSPERRRRAYLVNQKLRRLLHGRRVAKRATAAVSVA